MDFIFVEEIRGENKLVVRRRKSSSSLDEIDSGRPIFSSYAPTIKSSLLVQSLIGSICNFFENDHSKAKELTKQLCRKLWESNMIDNSYERPEFEGIRLQYSAAIDSLIKLIKESSLPIQKLEAVPLKSENTDSIEWSRYFSDFDEIEKISHGGFGEVFKAKHKIDKHVYAIKKILISSDHVNNVLSHFREVNTFASLNHLNVVAYHACWLEPLIFYKSEHKLVDQDDSATLSIDSEDNVQVTKTTVKDSLRLKSDSSFTIDFEYSEGHEKHQSEEDEKFETDSRLKELRQLSTRSQNGALIPHVKIAWSVLYIQMKLCQKTLRNFIDERNNHLSFQSYYNAHNLLGENENVVALKILLQISNGLEYIHNKSIVHHDLKPSNVFISFDYDAPLFQLGDFGLSCPLENNKMTRHDGFGTRLYAAKEQIDGKICSKKSDIYSLGIIFIEIISKCSTTMETAKKIDRIKNEEVIDDIEPRLSHLISKLLNVNYELRPSISELKDEIKELIEHDEITKLKSMIVEKDKEIESRDKQIEELMGEILKLKKQVSNE